MSTITRRIQRIYPALSAKERVLLALEERKARGVEDPFVLASTPPGQVAEVNRLLRDVGIVNHKLGGVILGLSQATRALEWRWRWFEALACHAADLDHVHRALQIRGPSPTRLRPPIDVEAAEDDTFAGRAPGLLKGVRDELVELAAGAQATEQILGEFSGELGATRCGRTHVRCSTRRCSGWRRSSRSSKRGSGRCGGATTSARSSRWHGTSSRRCGA